MEKTTKLSADLGVLLAGHGHVLTTAESCTGGGVAAAITDIAGSSGWLDRAFVTYSNEAKNGDAWSAASNTRSVWRSE